MKRLKIDYEICIGCRRCEVACSLKHYPGSVNPEKSRIRVFIADDHFYPVVAGPFNDAECTSKNVISIQGRQYDACVICRASCPIKPWFKEPETQVALKCDFCGDPPDPNCVRWCPCAAITVVED
jgi:benzoyl-CoA reductase subunit BamC